MVLRLSFLVLIRFIIRRRVDMFWIIFVPLLVVAVVMWIRAEMRFCKEVQRCIDEGIDVESDN